MPSRRTQLKKDFGETPPFPSPGLLAVQSQAGQGTCLASPKGREGAEVQTGKLGSGMWAAPFQPRLSVCKGQTWPPGLWLEVSPWLSAAGKAATACFYLS